MTINCKGTLIDLSKPHVMGILNRTPDSFYDGGKHLELAQAIDQAGKMLEEGASFIDIGGYSSRPGATNISASEETDRVVPLIETIIQHFPECMVSIDTFRASVAQKAVNAGAAIINDISAGLLDSQMLEVVAQLQVPYIMMHMRGTPQTMKSLTTYSDVTKEVVKHMSERVESAYKAGIQDVIIDPGFGFAKDLNQNYTLLNNLEFFDFFELPILVGLSRKSMIYKELDVTAPDALNGTTALHMIALSKGATLLRVHDAAEAVQCVKLWGALTRKNTQS